MNVHRLVAAVSATVLVAGLAFAQRGRERTIHVKSTDYKYASRRVENRGVRLVKRQSKSPCIEGRTWGYSRNRIWVRGGCEADFAYLPRRR